jgi:hypothetical protein
MDWEHLKETIVCYMKERIKMLRIDYVVIFIKIWGHDNSDQTDGHDDLEMEEIVPVRKSNVIIYSLIRSCLFRPQQLINLRKKHRKD